MLFFATVLLAATWALGAGVSVLLAALRAANRSTTPAVLRAVAAGTFPTNPAEQARAVELLNGIIAFRPYRGEARSPAPAVEAAGVSAPPVG